MAGHSKFKNIMYRKGAQDKKKAGLFSKLVREIIVATREGGGDPDGNTRLRLAIQTARANSMPKENIERAIVKGSGGVEGNSYESMRYEGYGPGGVAMMVESLTDNKNRTASELRTLFNKAGGSLGEPGSVAFLFERVGELCFGTDVGSFETVFEVSLEVGVLDVEEEEGMYLLTCEPQHLHTLSATLEEQFGPPRRLGLVWSPKTKADIPEKKVTSFLDFLETLESHDDVQTVFCNAHFPEA